MEKPPVIPPKNAHQVPPVIKSASVGGGKPPSPPVPPVIKSGPDATEIARDALKQAGDAVERAGDAAIDFAKNLFSGPNTANPGPGAPPPVNGPPPVGAAGSQPGTSTTNTARAIVVNGALLNAAQIQGLDQVFHCQFPNGRFWYDRFSGAWGQEGSGPRCVISAGLDLGAPLPADASHGRTRVFVNGRQIGFGELMQLGGYARFWPGRHWIDSGGNFGSEGKPPRGNLQIAQARSAMLTQMAMAIQIGAAMSGGGGGGSGGHESAISGWGITGVKVYDLS